VGTDMTREGAVTLVITRRVKPGCEAAYEDWLLRLQADARSLPGYQGVTTHRPAAGAPRDYVSVVRFQALEHLQAFEQSELRARYADQVAPFVEADAVWEKMTGLEFWFTPPPGTVVPQPSRARMVLLMTAVVFLLVLSIGSAVTAVAARLPFAVPYPVRLLVTIGIEVTFMTYWLMPRLTKGLARWIYPHQVRK
jgi:antibiotic biosynthesis monooxygenase (ABM) superfamily enzyme